MIELIYPLQPEYPLSAIWSHSSWFQVIADDATMTNVNLLPALMILFLQRNLLLSSSFLPQDGDRSHPTINYFKTYGMLDTHFIRFPRIFVGTTATRTFTTWNLQRWIYSFTSTWRRNQGRTGCTAIWETTFCKQNSISYSHFQSFDLQHVENLLLCQLRKISSYEELLIFYLSVVQLLLTDCKSCSNV